MRIYNAQTPCVAVTRSSLPTKKRVCRQNEHSPWAGISVANHLLQQAHGLPNWRLLHGIPVYARADGNGKDGRVSRQPILTSGNNLPHPTSSHPSDRRMHRTHARCAAPTTFPHATLIKQRGAAGHRRERHRRAMAIAYSRLRHDDMGAATRTAAAWYRRRFMRQAARSLRWRYRISADRNHFKVLRSPWCRLPLRSHPTYLAARACAAPYHACNAPRYAACVRCRRLLRAARFAAFASTWAATARYSCRNGACAAGCVNTA